MTRISATPAGTRLLAALAGCVEETGGMDTPLRTASVAAEQGCLQGVNTTYGRPAARVTSSGFSEADTEVMITAEGETWRCLVSEGGEVRDLSMVGCRHRDATVPPGVTTADRPRAVGAAEGRTLVVAFTSRERTARERRDLAAPEGDAPPGVGTSSRKEK